MKKITMDEIVVQAKDVLKTRGRHLPQLMIEDREGKLLIVVIADMPPSGPEKDKLREAIKNLIRIHGSERYFLVMETWMSFVKQGEKLYRQPSRDVDRIEALTISKFEKGEKEVLRIFPFKKKEFRNKEIIIFEKEMKSPDHSESRWDVWQDMEEMDKKQDKAIAEINDAFIKKMAKNLSDKHKKEFFDAETPDKKMEILKKIIKEGKQKFHDQKKTILEDVSEEYYDKV